MQKADIQTEVQNIFRDIFDDEDITLQNDMTAKDVEDWDSLNHINIIVACEQKFSIKFTTKEVRELANVGEFLSLIEKKKS